MSYFTNNIILYGLRNTFNAYKVYNANQELFNEFVSRNRPTADVKNASVKLILLVRGRIDDWQTHINKLEENKEGLSFISGWKTIYQQEFEATHFVPLSMPFAFRRRSMISNLIFYWLLHKLWFDQKQISHAWYSSHHLLDFITQVLYSPNNLPMKKFKRWLLIDGIITVFVESLLYINLFSIILYFIFVLIPRLVNKYAVGSPILIIIFHLILLVRFFF